MLWPQGVTSMEEMSVDLLRAINHANKILDWHENLIEDEIPPEWMWPFDDALTEWFEDVKFVRKNPGSEHTTSEHTTVPMMQNELAADRGKFSE